MLREKFTPKAGAVRVFAAQPDGSIVRSYQSLAQRAEKKAALQAGLNPAMPGAKAGFDF